MICTIQIFSCSAWFFLVRWHLFVKEVCVLHQTLCSVQIYPNERTPIRFHLSRIRFKDGSDIIQLDVNLSIQRCHKSPLATSMISNCEKNVYLKPDILENISNCEKKYLYSCISDQPLNSKRNQISCGRIFDKFLNCYQAFHILAQIYTANHATFPIQIYTMTVQICGNFWGTQ